MQFVVLIYGFIVPKLILKTYGSNVNGLISSITQFLGYISLLEVGFGPVVKAALYKPIANKDKKQIKEILKSSEKFFKIIAVVFIIYSVLLAMVYPLFVSEDFSFFYSMSLVFIIAISIFAEYYFGMSYKLYIQAEQKTYIISIISILGYILNIIVVIILVNANTGIHVIKLISSLIFMLRPILQSIYVKLKYQLDLSDVENNVELKQKWDGLAQHIAAVVHGNTDVVLLTIFTSVSEVSVYTIYLMVINGIKSLIQAFSNGIEAIFGDMIAKNELEKLNEKFLLYELFYFSVITILFACTFVLIVPFVSVYTLRNKRC